MTDVSNHKPQPPPGIVLGPDGKPCKVCTAFRDWRPQKRAASKSNDANTGAAAATPVAAAALVKSVDAQSQSQSRASPLSPKKGFELVEEYVPPDHCPPDVEQLGRATWTFLHTTAAYYPERPNPLQQSRMRSLLGALPTLYPCGHCAEHLGQQMKANPPDVSGRGPLSLWLCQRHNDVNEILGKPLFDCSKTDERWKDGPPDGSCD